MHLSENVLVVIISQVIIDIYVLFIICADVEEVFVWFWNFFFQYVHFIKLQNKCWLFIRLIKETIDKTMKNTAN